MLATDLPGTLRRIADIGFTQVEPYNFTAFPELGRGLAAAGLAAPTAHAHFIEVDPRPVFAAARELGIETVIEPQVTAERWQTADDVADIAARLNATAKTAAEYGIRIGYHNHAHELKLIDGSPALELLAERLDDTVSLELDAYWVIVGGQDPVDLLRKLGERVVALHVKDGPGTSDPRDQVAVGNGTLPIAAILDAAPEALRVIELDDSRGDRFTAVVDSHAFLTSLGVQ
ncbi:sugar phosphate isomerase/epimerase [Microbacterium sp. LTA6]|uniref:sugar phosphate isomerase/epimerase family protein n=1 Tax=unclassified Microbacterium TaxID=2609290 RepID=UPI0031394A87